MKIRSPPAPQPAPELKNHNNTFIWKEKYYEYQHQLQNS